MKSMHKVQEFAKDVTFLLNGKKLSNYRLSVKSCVPFFLKVRKTKKIHKIEVKV